MCHDIYAFTTKSHIYECRVQVFSRKDLPISVEMYNDRRRISVNLVMQNKLINGMLL